MGAVVDRLSLTLSEVKEYLKVDGNSEDVTLATLLAAAKDAADLYLNNDFVDSTGDPLDIPAVVKLWVLQYCGRFYEARSSGLKESDVTDLGVSTWGDLDFGPLRKYRKYPGFGPSGTSCGSGC